MKKALYFENGLEPEITGSENQENEIEISEGENPKEHKNLYNDEFNSKKEN